MTTEPINPFASPHADISATGKPEADQSYPLTATATATIEDVPTAHQGKVRTLSKRFLVSLPNVTIPITVGVAFYFFALFGPAWLNLGGNASLIFMLASITIVVTVVYLLANMFCQDRWWEKLIRRQIETRPAPWVPSTSSTAEFVTLTSTQPKSMASFQLGSNEAEIIDIGLLLLDKTKGEMVLECDNRRYRIPRGSLLACDMQQIKLQSPWTPVVKVACQTTAGPHEFCIMPADIQPWLAFTTRYRKRQAQLLADKILELPEPL